VTIRLGVLISGSGSNLQAIIDARDIGALDAEIALVISNRDDAFGLTRARQHDIPALFVDRDGFASFREYNFAIRDALREHNVEWVVMAGYMRLLGREVLDAFPSHVLNLHPALLPSFPGASGIVDALDYGVKVTGVTVHFADEEFDEGPILAQEAVEVAEDDTLETLTSKIHEIEHRIYPKVLQLIAEDRVQIVGRKVKIRPAS
jgi:phosphoribosylglycinamide formyltransferase 1